MLNHNRLIKSPYTTETHDNYTTDISSKNLNNIIETKNILNKKSSVLILSDDNLSKIPDKNLNNKNDAKFIELLHRGKESMGIINCNMMIIDCNQAAVHIFDLNNRKALIGCSAIDISDPKTTTASTYSNIKVYLQKALTEGYQRFEWVHQTAMGTIKNIEVTLIPILYLGQIHLQAIWRDITQLKQKQLKVQKLADIDPLSGLPNQHLFVERVNDLISLANQQHQSLVMIHLELTDLTETENTLGYAAGDALIQAASQRMLNAINTHNTLPSRNQAGTQFYPVPDLFSIDREFHALARTGRDTFALAAVISSPNSSAFLVQRIHSLFDHPFYILSKKVKISVNAGISLYPQHTKNLTMMMRSANLALNQAKKNNMPYCYFNLALSQQINNKARLIQRLEKTLANDQRRLSIQFQPQVHLSTGRLAGAEVSLRWNDKKLGPISAATFIPYAEESGLIKRLTQHLIHSVHKQLFSWKDSNSICLERLDVPLEIQISSTQIAQAQRLQALCSLFNTSELSEKNLVLAFSEAPLTKDPDASITLFNQLRQAGFKLAINDFATGNWPLSYLKDMNADILKIDQSTISTMFDNEKNLAVIKSMIAIAQLFGMVTLAQGIEDQKTAEMLVVLGCDYGQGNFYSKALSPRMFEKKWLLKLPNQT